MHHCLFPGIFTSLSKSIFMRSAFWIFILFLSAPVAVLAQDGYVYNGRPQREEPSTLSIFSENGAPFFLVLNGVNQNNVPQTKIRVEGLPQYGNDIEILFADNRTPGIRKTVNIADPVDGKAVNMTLKIVMGREGARLRFVKCSEIDHNYRPPHDEYVMSYGRPQQVTRTTTTITTTNNNDSYQPPAQPAGPPAVDRGTFAEMKKSIAAVNFDDTRISTAKTIIKNNYFTTDQVMELCRLFSFDDSKLDVAKYAYSHTVDANNYFKVANVFSFDANKQALNDYISSQPH